MTAVNTSKSAPWIALIGNPNSGKTAIFNLLTGMNQKVSNYPGVTVERKLGGCQLGSGDVINILDMPGTYSLTPESYDEQIVTEQVLSWRKEGKAPVAIVSILDATNFSRNLYLTTQLLDIGYPVVVVLNMMDKVQNPEGLPTDTEIIDHFEAASVVRMSAIKKQGVDELKSAIEQAAISGKKPTSNNIPYKIDPQLIAILQPLISAFSDQMNYSPRLALSQSLRFITRSSVTNVFRAHYNENHPEFFEKLISFRPKIIQRLKDLGFSNRTLEATLRYNWIDSTLHRLHEKPKSVIHDKTHSEKADSILTHPWSGPLIFIVLLAGIFQSIFSWATIPMDLIDSGITQFSQLVYKSMPDGILRSLIVEGIIAGVGAILIFLPQILILVFAL
ncbi:MAG: ferrous iron transporter B, partial [Candidatus Marinimicrobia bacterium]|nr:ferrous iron transporter B [Candidatus Neomarinimicrobiota bacterium]